MSCKHACITIPHPHSDSIWPDIILLQCVGACMCVPDCGSKTGCVLQDYTIYNVLLLLWLLWWIWTRAMEMKYRNALCALFSSEAEWVGKHGRVPQTRLFLWADFAKRIRRIPKSCFPSDCAGKCVRHQIEVCSGVLCCCSVSQSDCHTEYTILRLTVAWRSALALLLLLHTENDEVTVLFSPPQQWKITPSPQLYCCCITFIIQRFCLFCFMQMKYSVAPVNGSHPHVMLTVN